MVVCGHYHLLTSTLWRNCGASFKGRSVRLSGSMCPNSSSGFLRHTLAMDLRDVIVFVENDMCIWDYYMGQFFSYTLLQHVLKPVYA